MPDPAMGDIAAVDPWESAAARLRSRYGVLPTGNVQTAPDPFFPDVARGFPRALAEGGINALDFLAKAGETPAQYGVAPEDKPSIQPGVDALRARAEELPQSETRAGKVVNAIGEVAANPLNWLGVGPARAAAYNAASGAMGELARQYAEGTPYEKYAKLVGQFTPMAVERGYGLVPQGAAGMAGGRLLQPQGIRAYHSSPHDFDRFDISKIGTGEGAQVYGHGLYFAENPAVSGQGGQYWQQFLNRLDANTPEFNAASRLRAAGWDRAKAIDEAQQDLSDWHAMLPTAKPDQVAYFNKMRGTREQELALLRSGNPVGPRTYEVNIAAQPEQFLDWDKPLAKMSPEVRQQLNDAWIAHPESHAHQTGQQIYAAHDWDADAHNVLRDAGIPGIKYLDQGSRAVKPVYNLKDPGQLAAYAKQLYPDNAVQALKIWGGPEGEAARQLLKSGQSLPALKDLSGRPPPTSNYVVFDDKLIDILRKYGIAGMAPPVMGALVQPDGTQQ